MKRALRIAAWIAFALFGIVLMMSMGLFAPLELMFWLVAGWARFTVDTLPRVSVSWGHVAMAAATVALLSFGLHRFLKWLAPSMGGPEWRWRWTLSAVALLALLFGTSVASAGIVHQTAWLASQPMFEDRWGRRRYDAPGALGETCQELWRRAGSGPLEGFQAEMARHPRYSSLHVVPVPRGPGVLALAVFPRDPALRRAAGIATCDGKGPASHERAASIADVLTRLSGR